MPKNIFPHEVARYSVEQHFMQHSNRGRIIYLTVIGLVLLAFAIMLFVKVDVSVNSPGIIRSVQEKTDIRLPVNGVIDSVYIAENTHVVAGQPMLKIRGQNEAAFGNQYQEIKTQYEDLQALLSGKTDGLRSELYRQQYQFYRQRLNDASIRYELVKKNYNRYASLYASKVISTAEFEKSDYEFKAVASEMSLLKQQQYSQWQTDLSRIKLQLGEMDAKHNLYDEENGLFVIKAPVTGTVHQLRGLQPGMYVSNNEMLGEISPDSGLVAEAYVQPQDIGLLQRGNKVNIQLASFDYNLWGMMPASILSVSDDVFTENGKPFFKVRCRLQKNMLQLKNGQKGFIKKGMTLQARFFVAKRTLFQLLYDHTDDWLNPNQLHHEG